MKKYVIVTNIWGRAAFKEEKEQFDTKEELEEYIQLFEGVCSQYKKPEMDPKRPGFHKWNKFYDKEERFWGYLCGDSEKRKILKWGGRGLQNIHRNSHMFKIYDYIFREEGEIPKDYKWDDGEYEGWLQYRWGDGKNAIGYVEKKKPQKKSNEPINEPISSLNDDPNYDFAEELEEKYAKYEDSERVKLLQERW